jgi:spermidine synthase
VITSTGDWQLQSRGSHYEIICNGVFLMASYNRESDRDLARLALARVEGDALRVLVGGLGIGFTTQVVLEDARVKRLDIVEVEPVVTSWHRTYFAPLSGWPLDDARTHLIEQDLYDLPLAPHSFDAMLLDTDNGPNWLARDVNARLYTPETLRRFLDGLTPKGVLAFWSADSAPAFAKWLAGLAGRVEAVEVPEEIAPDRPGTAWIYLAIDDR